MPQISGGREYAYNICFSFAGVQKLIKVIGVWRLDRIVILNFRFVCVAVCCLEEMDREGLRAVMEHLVILRGESLCDTL